MAQDKNRALEKIVSLGAPLGVVTGKAMFGGLGVFCDGLMFALITRQGDLYLKADDGNRLSFEEVGLESYGKMPYYRAPEGSLDSWASLEPWARGAVEAAKRAPAKSPKRAKKLR